MSKWALVTTLALIGVFGLFSYLPLTAEITAGSIANPDNVGWRFLQAVFPIGWLVVTFLFLITAIYAAITEE